MIIFYGSPGSPCMARVVDRVSRVIGFSRLVTQISFHSYGKENNFEIRLIYFPPSGNFGLLSWILIIKTEKKIKLSRSPYMARLVDRGFEAYRVFAPCRSDLTSLVWKRKLFWDLFDIFLSVETFDCLVRVWLSKKEF